MTRWYESRWATVAGVTLPGLLLGAVGLTHPSGLAPSSATYWWQLHVLLLPLFPLLAAALWVLLRGERGVLAWAARIAAYGYAAFYTGLDALAGIAAGVVVETVQGGSQAAIDVSVLGDRLGDVGTYCFLAAALLTSAVLARRDGARVLPGAAVLLLAAWSFRTSHIFPPVGVLTMVAIGVGCGLLAAARRPEVPAARAEQATAAA